MLFTHWHYTSVSGEVATFITSMRNLVFYSLNLVSVSVFIWFLKSEVRTIPKRNVNDDDSVVHHILKTIDDQEFSKMVPLTEVCFDTNIRKIKHGEYCAHSDSYVIEYQKY
mmetsp:Transcript_21124/g.18733  ORF Transcript_21124/g.18733 Transcript_21124/m.18733 type:complete len:111 (+) Transcript_21124:568-900(+)